MSTPPPEVPAVDAPSQPSRWEKVAGFHGYGARFAELVAQGADLEGEARLADVLAPRGATILDAGSGMGRTGAALRRRGHDAYGVDLDPRLLEQSRATYPDLPVAPIRLEQLSAPRLAAAGLPTAYDLVVCVGNVMIYLVPGTEVEVLRRFAGVLRPGGRVLLGFESDSRKPEAGRYPADALRADATMAGLAVQHLFSSFELAPWSAHDTFVVAVLARPE